MMKAKLLWVTPNPEQEIVDGMLDCRNLHDDVPSIRDKKPLAERIGDIWEYMHFSCFEEAEACIIINGVSRSFSHQLVRHRLFTYKQLSMRYVPITKLGTITPPSIDGNINARFIYACAVQIARAVYEMLIALGIPEEDARFVAPIGTETQVRVKGNLRQWLHLMNMRTQSSRDPNEEYVPKKGPQWEIRAVAWQCYELLHQIAPNVFDMKYSPLWKYV